MEKFIKIFGKLSKNVNVEKRSCKHALQEKLNNNTLYRATIMDNDNENEKNEQEAFRINQMLAVRLFCFSRLILTR